MKKKNVMIDKKKKTLHLFVTDVFGEGGFCCCCCWISLSEANISRVTMGEKISAFFYTRFDERKISDK